MKQLFLISLILSIGITNTNAATSIDIQAGEFRSSTATIVSDSSLWAIIYDENNDGILAGGLDANVSSSFLDNSNVGQIVTDFNGLTITQGQTVGGDRILRVFELDSANKSGADGVAFDSLSNIDYGTEGVSQSRKYGVYWFPTLTLASNTFSNSEIGGFFFANAQTGGDVGTVFPAPDFSYTAAFLSTDQGGNIAPSQFNAITIPEPSAALLGLFGVGALLMRRRR